MEINLAHQSPCGIYLTLNGMCGFQGPGRSFMFSQRPVPNFLTQGPKWRVEYGLLLSKQGASSCSCLLCDQVNSLGISVSFCHFSFLGVWMGRVGKQLGSKFISLPRICSLYSIKLQHAISFSQVLVMFSSSLIVRKMLIYVQNTLQASPSLGSLLGQPPLLLPQS